MAIENYMPDFAVEAVYDLTVPSSAGAGNQGCFGRFGQYPHCLEQPWWDARDEAMATWPSGRGHSHHRGLK